MTAELPPMPDPPPRTPVEPGVCGALKSPDNSKLLCCEPAGLYPCGWRCDTHRPRTRPARKET